MTQEHPGLLSCPIDFKEVRDCLIINTKDLPELHPDQPVLFLSPADAN